MLTPTALASSVATQAECGWSVYQQTASYLAGSRTSPASVTEKTARVA